MTTTIQPYDLQLSNLFRNGFKFSRLFQYKSRFSFHIETEKYIVKTAEKLTELYPIFKLRQESFLLNDQSSTVPFLIDIDEHDFNCDHIVIIDKKSARICGTYRMQTSLTTSTFYSQNEFVMDQFLRTPGIKLELGRACIHPEFRNGAVIDLLWRGIARYVQLTNSRYFFGCSSVRITDPFKASQLVAYLKGQHSLSTQWNIYPTPQFTMKGLTEFVSFDESHKKLLPSLLRNYLQAGAMVYGNPALDEDYSCIDFLTILDIKNIEETYRKRYFPFL
jgi:putative hemolysin